MLCQNIDILGSGIFITFSGNCEKALTFYHTCFGGVLHFETFPQELQGFQEAPVILGSLISKDIIIHGSDLVLNEGIKIGNNLSVFLLCKSEIHRKLLIEKLKSDACISRKCHENHKLVEIIDPYHVNWILGI
jgi:PhnB protein